MTDKGNEEKNDFVMKLFTGQTRCSGFAMVQVMLQALEHLQGLQQLLACDDVGRPYPV
jgi:hypothetical protein